MKKIIINDLLIKDGGIKVVHVSHALSFHHLTTVKIAVNLIDIPPCIIIDITSKTYVLYVRGKKAPPFLIYN